MFGWFAPTCPVDLISKVWVERRLSWLIERFGSDRILNAPRVLPTHEFFPEPYNGTPEEMPVLFARVCKFMGADPRRFHLERFSENERPDAQGLYYEAEQGLPTISIKEEILPDQESVIAVMAHEIAHDLLLGSKLLNGDEEDHEQLTDLLPVALGMGTFHCNTTIKQKSGIEGSMTYWQISKTGYLTASLCGYAMGVIEYLRQPTSAPSVKYLGLDAAEAMRSGYRYLLKTGDCLIDRDHPARINPPRVEPLDPGVHGFASRCLYVLQSWNNGESLSPAQIAAAQISLGRKEPAIQCTALVVLTQSQPISEPVVEQILEKLLSSDLTVREYAALVIPRLNLPANHVTKVGDPLVEILLNVLKDPSTNVAVAAAQALGSFGSEAILAVPRILSLLVAATAKLSPDAELLVGSLNSIVGDLRQYLNENPEVIGSGHRELISDYLRARPSR